MTLEFVSRGHVAPKDQSDQSTTCLRLRSRFWFEQPRAPHDQQSPSTLLRLSNDSKLLKKWTWTKVTTLFNPFFQKRYIKSNFLPGCKLKIAKIAPTIGDSIQLTRNRFCNGVTLQQRRKDHLWRMGRTFRKLSALKKSFDLKPTDSRGNFHWEMQTPKLLKKK